MKRENTMRVNADIKEKIMPILWAYCAMAVLCIAAEIMKPGFMAASHIQNLLKQNAFLGIVCVGQMMVIITGGTDLSITYNITLCNVISSQIMYANNGNILKCFLTVVLIGALIGMANGLGIHFLKIPSMIMTLGTGTVLQGIGYIYTQGAPKGSTAPALAGFINGRPGGITYGIVLIWILVSAVTILIMRYTQFGRSVFAVGANPVAADFSGVNSGVTLCKVYVISGVMSAVVGMLLVGYAGTAYLYTGDPYNMDSIAACVVGGTLVAGGKGSYIGVIAGVLLMAALDSILIMVSMPEAIRKMVKGIVILIMILLVHNKKED